MMGKDTVMLVALRQRNFALLWFGQLISLTGDYVLIVALPFYTYQLTGSVLATGVMFLVQALPGLFLGSLAGVFVDRWDRRWTMIASDLLRAGVLLFLLLARSRDLVWIIYVVAFTEQLISLFFIPAKGAIIPNLVEEQHLMAANSLNSTSDAITRLVGPPLGGALLALLGLSSTVFIDSASYLVSALMILLIAMPARSLPAGEALAVYQKEETEQKTKSDMLVTLAGVWREWLDGLRLVIHERILLTLFVAEAIIMLSQGIINVLIVVFVKTILHGDASTFGLLITFQGIGMLAGAVLVGQLEKRLKPAYLLALGTVPAGIAVLAIVNVANIVLTLALITVVGVLVVSFFITEQTLLQSAVADEYRGRVLGAYGTTSSLFYIIGIGCGSVLGGLLGVVGALDIAGALFALAGVVALLMLRGIDVGAAGQSGEAVIEQG
jgi:MFS family permease